MSSPKSLHLTITTPERIVLESEVSSVNVPTVDGEIGLLPDHIPLVSLLAPGELHAVTTAGEEQIMAVSGGFIEVRDNQVVILADTAEHAHEIDEQRAEEARQKAQQIMTERATDDVGFADAQAAMAKELARLKVVRKKRKNV
ncbi:MAG: F0F1 ATP synthase subunit epsilon [bacterium]|nr:F0F1 ATP synthase subunit epsilon [bacterium]